MAVAVIHSGFAVLAFPDALGEMIARRVFDTVGEDPLTGAVAWFVLFGFLLFVTGMAIDDLEQRSPCFVPRSLGVGLLALATTGIVLMPLSGFWLALPPAVAILRFS